MKLSLFFITSLWTILVSAQSDSDLNKVSFFTDVVHSGEMGKTSEDVLRSKINQIILQNSQGSTNAVRFAVIGRATLIDETTASTVPPMHKMVFNIDVIVADVIEKKNYGIQSFRNCVGLNRNRERAIVQALSAVKSNKEIKNLLNDAKKKILDYYRNNCDFVITEASTLGEQRRYDEAIEKLSGLPKVSEECFYIAQSKIVELAKQRDGRSTENITENHVDVLKNEDSSDSLPKNITPAATQTSATSAPKVTDEVKTTTAKEHDKYEWLD